ncbi:MAG: aminotransferase class I/II-fold pyridoxal phosphate-dependent enzyme [Candidatus Pristimantibacillus sp.]
MNSLRAPLFESLIRLVESDPVSFHVPGHRYGQAFDQLPSSEEKQWFSTIMKLDVTELTATDDLHHPEASIAEAQRLAAKCFGAEETFFLVGGSTSGNIALLLAVCTEPGDLIIVQRNVHKSIINGLKLAGARAVFVTPRYDEVTGAATIPSAEALEEMLQRYPEAKAVLLTNPNYYGMSTNMSHYADMIHKYDKVLLVDEAHGAHYGFHPELPASALQAGADAVVQSTHKTLTALTMGAMLHVQGDRLSRTAIQQALAVIQSSSPSFPIMASLDISRAMIDRYGSTWFAEAIASATLFRQWLLKKDSSALTTVDLFQSSTAYDQLDPLRIVMWDESGTLTGYELQQQLDQRGCWAEMADPSNVVLLFGIKTNMEDVHRLIDVCSQIEEVIVAAGQDSLNDQQRGLTRINDQVMTASSDPVLFTRTNNRRTGRVKLVNAASFESAEMIVPYPPGIPIVYPGEQLSEEIIQYILRLAQHGAKFQGALDPAMETIEVYI